MKDTDISRRKALLRIGALASATYATPLLSTVSMAHASSDSSDSSDASEASDPSVSSDSSNSSDSSGPSRSRSRASRVIDRLDVDRTTKRKLKSCARRSTTADEFAACVESEGMSVADLFPDGVPLK